MSLINKMLQDLDARNASAAERAGLSPRLRALPPKASYPWRGPAMAVAGALVGAVAVWFIVSPGELPPAPVQAPPPPAAVAVAPMPAPALPALVVPLPPEPEPRAKPVLPPVTKPAPTVGRGLGIDVSLKVDDRLDPPPSPQARALSSSPASPTGIDKQARTTRTWDAADAEYRRAMTSLRSGQIADGMSGLRTALKLEGHHTLARQALLSALVEQHAWAEAQAVAAEGLALDPAQSGWAMILARLQVERGDLALAADTLSQHLAHAERNADYQAFYALLLHKQQRSREAAQRYQAAVALRPSEGRWWYGLGLALEADQRSQEARDAFARAKDTGNLPPDLLVTVEQKLRP